MKQDTYTEQLTFIKTASSDEKLFYIFQSSEGHLRAVESHLVTQTDLQPGYQCEALVRKKGCSTRIIERLYM